MARTAFSTQVVPAGEEKALSAIEWQLIDAGGRMDFDDPFVASDLKDSAKSHGWAWGSSSCD